jgi:hypothetical protein
MRFKAAVSTVKLFLFRFIAVYIWLQTINSRRAKAIPLYNQTYLMKYGALGSKIHTFLNSAINEVQ